MTGGAGFIGAHLVNRLVSIQAGEIIVLDNLHRGYSRASLPRAIDFRDGDIRDQAVVARAMRGCDIVFHLAAVADSSYAFTTNVAGTFIALEVARATGARRLVFTSSREVYGDPKTIPVPETAPLGGKNAYGASKLAGEVYCRLAAHQGLETVVLRLANVYGPGDRDRVIPLFAAAAAAGETITVYDRQKLLDFIWIDRVVDALLEAGLGRYIRGLVNVGSGKGTTIADLAGRIVELTKSTSTIKVVEERAEEVGRFVADITRGRRLLRIQEVEDPPWALPKLLSGPAQYAAR